MIIHTDPQGSEAWLLARAGVITGSRFRDARDRLKSGAPSQKQISYAAQVAVERIAGKPVEMTFASWQMKAGTAEEPFARIEYEAATGALVEEAGFITTDDRLFGLSVDGLVDDDGVIEVKTICSPEKMIAIYRDRDFSEYIDQCNAPFWLLRRKWTDLVIRCPALVSVGKGLLIHRIHRDDDFVNQLEADMLKFAAMVDENERILRLEAA